MVGTNCYVVYNENTKECFVLGPAAHSLPLVEFLLDRGSSVAGNLLTHGHFDHIMGIDTLQQGMVSSCLCQCTGAEGSDRCQCESVCCIWSGVCVCGRQVSGRWGISRTCRISDPYDLHSGAYGGRMLLLYRRRGGSFQRRYTVCRLCWKNRFSDRQYEYTGAFGKRAIAEPSGRYAGVSGTMEATTIGFEKENNPFL